MTTKKLECLQEIELTIRVTPLSKGYMADLEQFPEIMVYSPTKKGLITKLITCISGYEEAFPMGIEKKLSKTLRGNGN